jgi:PKHD-type hydroxylase
MYQLTWYGNVLSPEYCEYLIRKLNTFEFQTGQTHEEVENEIFSGVRKSRIAWAHHDEEIRKLTEHHAQLINRSDYAFDIYPIGCNEIQYTEYHSSNEGKYDWHDDLISSNNISHKSQRKLSLIFQLSNPNNYEGGDIEFMNIDVDQNVLKQQGTIIAFPSFIKHRVTPVTSGVRNSIVTWIEGPPFR